MTEDIRIVNSEETTPMADAIQEGLKDTELPIASKEELLSACKKIVDGEQTVYSYPSVDGKSRILIKAILKNSHLSKIMENEDFKVKNKAGVLDSYSDDTIGAAVWISECCINPSFTFDEALLLAEGSGFWTNTIAAYIKRICGISPELIEKMTNEFKLNPFGDSTSRPA